MTKDRDSDSLSKPFEDLYHNEGPINYLAVDLDFLGVVVDNGELKAEFGPLGFYKAELAPPSTYLIGLKLFFSYFSTIDSGEVDHDTYMRRVKEWNKASDQVRQAIAFVQNGELDLEDFDPPYETPQSVLSDFLIDANV